MMKLIFISALIFTAIILAIAQTEPILGGIQPVPNADTLLPELLKLEREIDAQMNSTFVHRVNKILEARSQIVSGIIYYFTYLLNETTCLKETTTAVELCNEVSKTHRCQTDVWIQSWLNFTKIVKHECEPVVA